MNLQIKNSQISIFITISIIILFLFVFMIFYNFSDKKEPLNEDFKNTDAQVSAIKEKIDYCLQRELRRALIIAGVRGGFIYDKGEYYSPSSIPAGTYNSEFISNMDLNWNYLQFSTLIHSQSDVFSPLLNDKLSINDSGVITEVYTHSIKDDFEKFILDEFIKCESLDDIEELGFRAKYQIYSNDVEFYNPSTKVFVVKNFDVEVGEKVRISTTSLDLEGVVLSVSDEEVLVQGSFNQNLVLENDISSIWVSKVNSNISLDVIFEDDKVNANLNFPLVFTNNLADFQYEDSFISIPVRFSKLLELSKHLLRNKYLDKEIDYFNESDLKRILEKNIYVKNGGLGNVGFEVTIVNDTQDYKQYVYSFIDYDSRVLGNPYVFSFGYVNKAPEIDPNRLSNLDLTEEGVLFIVSKNQKIDLDLKSLTSDEQIIDNDFSYYKDDSYEGLDASYSLSQEGLLSFVGRQERKFSFDITVTDKETTRIMPFIFLVGFPDNSDNSATASCLRFRNFGVDNFFPINYKFKDKIFTYLGENDYHNAYSYQLYVNPNNPVSEFAQKSYVEFSLTCLLSPEIYEGEVTITNKETGALIREDILNNETRRVEIDSLPYVQEVSIMIKDKRTNVPVTQPYNLTIYPTSCLGPEDIIPEKQAVLGGTMSCCDTTAVLNSVDTNTPRNFVNSNNLYTDSRKILDAPTYFCHDVQTLYLDKNVRDSQLNIHRNDIIWDFNSKITSLFEGNIVGICNGLSAVGDVSSVTASGSDTTLNAIGLSSSSGYVERNMQINLKTVQSANSCEFCYLKDYSEFNVVLDNGLVMRTGFKALNEQADSKGVGVIPNSYETNDVFIKCSNDIYRSKDANSWDKILTGDSNSKEQIHMSYGFCSQGSSICSGRVNSPNYDSRIDNVPICKNWYFNGEDLDFKDNTGWICGVNQTCSDGVCE
jgi:hypothetical protein